MLDKEQQEDGQLRILHGAKWTRTESVVLTAKLREKLSDYRLKMDVADRSNKVVRSKIDSQLYLVQHLTMSRCELEASIPASNTSTSDALKEPSLKELKSHLANLSVNLKQRPEIIASLKKKCDADDIGSLLTRNALEKDQKSENELFEEAFKTYEPEKQQIEALINAQETLIESIVVIAF